MSLHFNLTRLWLCLLFCYFVFFRDGDGRDGRRNGGSVFKDWFYFFFLFSSFFFLFSRLAQAHTYSQSLVTHCWACSFPCMDHPVTIVCKQCGEGRRDEADNEEKRYMLIYLNIYLKEYFFYLMLLCWGLGGNTRHVSHFAIGFHQQSTFEETQSKEMPPGRSFSLCMYAAISD